MKPWLMQKLGDLLGERPAGGDEDVHFSESFVEMVLEELTAPGDVVLDPFAGFGTTLVVAQRMGRVGIGVELLPERVELIRSRLAGDSARVVEGDARNLSSLVPGPVDLCLTSPPYMTATDHPDNPLNAYETEDGDYGRYLVEIADIFGQVAQLLRPGGHVAINVANVVEGDVITPLAWDMARVVGEHVTLRHECLLVWDEQPTGISSDYCLVFQ